MVNTDSFCHEADNTVYWQFWNGRIVSDLLPFSFLCLQLKLPQIQKIMMEFEKQSEIMDMKEEMMNDAIDDAMGEDDDEEER